MVSKKVIFFFIFLIGKNRHGIGKKVATVALIWNRYERKAENPLKTESYPSKMLSLTTPSPSNDTRQ